MAKISLLIPNSRSYHIIPHNPQEDGYTFCACELFWQTECTCLERPEVHPQPREQNRLCTAHKSNYLLFAER